MSTAKPMSTLRRPMPGMPATVLEPTIQTEPIEAAAPSTATAPATPGRRTDALMTPHSDAESASRHDGRTRSEASRSSSGGPASGRWMSADYSTTRLANFRLPVDLHDHYRELVREVEQTDPRLRRPSLTEVIIALLEEGPSTAAEVAELLRRRRVAENEWRAF